MECVMRSHLPAAGVTAVVGLVVAGVLNAPTLRALPRQDQVIIGQGPGQRSGGPAPDNLAFEVASVKPNKSGDGRIGIFGQPGGRFNATNVPLRLLIRNAYQLQDSQLVGGPDWIASSRFDIVAKAAAALA